MSRRRRIIKTVTDRRGSSHEVKIDEDLLWLWPYFMYAKRLEIPIWRVAVITGYTVPTGCERHQEAAIISMDNNKFKINLRKRKGLWKHIQREGDPVEDWMGQRCSSFLESALEALAHELSHVVFWEHDSERWELEKRIELSFARLAKRRGYRGYE